MRQLADNLWLLPFPLHLLRCRLGRNVMGMSRFFRLMIKEREAFRRSCDQLRALPIERLIVAHGAPIENNASQVLDATLQKHGF